MNEPLDPDEHFSSCCDVVDDEIKRLTGDNRALRMILKDCKGELLEFRLRINYGIEPERLSRIELLVQQIDEELKSE